MFNCCIPNYNMFMSCCCGNDMMNTMFKMSMFKAIMNNIFHPYQQQQQPVCYPMQPMMPMMPQMSIMPMTAQPMMPVSIFPMAQNPSVTYNSNYYNDNFYQNSSLIDIFKDTYNAIFKKKAKKDEETDKTTDKTDETTDKTDETNKKYKNKKTQNGTVKNNGTNTKVNTVYTGTAEDLNRLLAKRGVLAGKGEVFLSAQEKYGVNAAFLAAICINESCGTSKLAKTKNNVGGVRIAGKTEFKTYSSVDDCIMDIARFLKSGYLDKGLTTIGKIGAKYCPTDDPTDKDGTNGLWAGNVAKIYSNFA